MKTLSVLLKDVSYLSILLTPGQRRQYTDVIREALDHGDDLADVLLRLIGKEMPDVSLFEVGDRVDATSFTDAVTGEQTPERKDLFVRSTRVILTRETETFTNYQRIDTMDADGNGFEASSKFFVFSDDQRAITPRMAIGKYITDCRGLRWRIRTYFDGESVMLDHYDDETGETETKTIQFSELQTYTYNG
jgi:hypothetical protein